MPLLLVIRRARLLLQLDQPVRAPLMPAGINGKRDPALAVAGLDHLIDTPNARRATGNSS
jgi:hypothetical protein